MKDQFNSNLISIELKNVTKPKRTGFNSNEIKSVVERLSAELREQEPKRQFISKF